MRGLILALGFLTRIPVPALKDFKPEELPRAARWFPLVGIILGGLLAVAVGLGLSVDPWLAALLGVGAWILLTGGLHADGLADLADGLGAAHRDPQRLLAVMRDPHVGSFGVLALVLVVVAKLILLMLLALGAGMGGGWIGPLLLIPAWGRLGAMVWAKVLPPLASGSGERFGWEIAGATLFGWLGALLLLSLLLAPALLLAPLWLVAWWIFLHRRLGGMSGDALGAGVEIVEVGLLLTVVLLEGAG
ncbi:MAG: adenosylcobinamide-GDP ribazoletransferase [Alphaproteobacteria bacterium CG_4_10_14_0_2_um_filter_63_37]|nr:MAG: cobalamin 5'-phosphate synthase [Proteobacteria bacterium CG1_02_64_396]PJA25539.1 MAG: adenosylcobinamide-GDP ribazoletransferase [Alphaproteobacteria bacterium CG_4_10_14_0_2_um_filter_63_37]